MWAWPAWFNPCEICYHEQGRREPDRCQKCGRCERVKCERERCERDSLERGRPELGRPKLGRPKLGRSKLGRPELGRPRRGRPRRGRPRRGRHERGRHEWGMSMLIMALNQACTLKYDFKLHNLGFNVSFLFLFFAP